MRTPTRRQVLAGAFAAGASIVAAAPACRLVTAGPRNFDDLTVGAIGIFPSPGEKFEGELPETALRSALGKLNEEGGALGKRISFRGAQAGTEDEAYDGFRRLESDPSVIGIVLATPLATERIVAAAASARIPLISTAADLQGAASLWPDAESNRAIFQFYVPERWAIDGAVEYCKADRGYRRAALLYDDFLFPEAETHFREACRAAGLGAVASEQFGLDGLDLGAQISRLASTRAEALLVWADPQTTGNVAIELDAQGNSYADMEGAKSGKTWRPQMVGSPTGMFERDWADVAEAAAMPGSVAIGDIGAFRKGPRWLPEEWGEAFALDWDRKKAARRGMRPIVDSAYAFVQAVRRVGSADRSDVIRGLESGRDFKFASTRFGFSEQDHVALTKDDIALFTLEQGSAVSTTPPYSLGQEWSDGIMAERDMTLLVRPRLESNRLAHPDYVRSIVDGGYGTQCTRTEGGLFSAACKVH